MNRADVINRVALSMPSVIEGLTEHVSDLVDGAPTNIVILISAGDVCQYAANVDRATGAKMIAGVLARWELGMPDHLPGEETPADVRPFVYLLNVFEAALTHPDPASSGRGCSEMRQLIKVDGTVTDLLEPVSVQQIAKLIGADTLDTVNLRHLGEPLQVMMVDDTGMIDGKPVNPKATELYHQNCYPGVTHPICGDVVICPDKDFA
jgi:hypothetical protein